MLTIWHRNSATKFTKNSVLVDATRKSVLLLIYCLTKKHNFCSVMNAAYTQLQLIEAELQSRYSAAIATGNRKIDLEGVEEKVRSLFSHNITLLRSVMGFRMHALPLSQADLAELMGLSLPTVNKWENAVALPNRSVLTRLVGHINAILVPRPPVQEADVLFTSLLRTFIPASLHERTPSFVPEPRFGAHTCFIECTFTKSDIVFHQRTSPSLVKFTLHDIVWEHDWNEFSQPLDYALQSGVSCSGFFSVTVDNHKRFFDVMLYPNIHEAIVQCIGMEVTSRHNRYRAFKQQHETATLRIADMTIDYQQQRLRAHESQKAKERSDNRCDILRSMADNADNCLLVIDKKGIIIEANIRSIAVFSFDFDIIGHSLFAITTSTDRISDHNEELVNHIHNQTYLRVSLQVQNKEMIASFSPIWAGGLEYYIVKFENTHTNHV